MVSFTHKLTQLRKRWQALGFRDEFPIPKMKSDDMRVYQEQLETSDQILAVTQDIVETLGVEQDGWVPAIGGKA